MRLCAPWLSALPFRPLTFPPATFPPAKKSLGILVVAPSADGATTSNPSDSALRASELPAGELRGRNYRVVIHCERTHAVSSGSFLLNDHPTPTMVHGLRS